MLATHCCSSSSSCHSPLSIQFQYGFYAMLNDLERHRQLEREQQMLAVKLAEEDGVPIRWWQRCCRWSGGAWGCFVDIFLCVLRTFLPLSREPAIFDRLDAYSEDYLKDEWDALIYGKLEWNSIEATEKRLARVLKNNSAKEWNACIAEARKDKRESRFHRHVLRQLRKKMLYRNNTQSKWANEVWKVLVFAELPSLLRRSLDPEFGFNFSERIARSCFFVVAAGLKWLTVVVQILFPVLFLAAVFYFPMCY